MKRLNLPEGSYHTDSVQKLSLPEGDFHSEAVPQVDQSSVIGDFLKGGYRGIQNIPEALKQVYSGAPWHTDEESARIYAEAQKTRIPNIYEPGTAGYYGQLTGEALPSVGAVAATVPVALAGAPLAAVGLGGLYGLGYGFGTTRGASAYEGLADPEEIFDTAAVKGLISGFTESISEIIPIPLLSKFLRTPAGTTFIKKLADVGKKSIAGTGIEATTESLGNFAEQAINNYLYGDEYHIQELIDSFVVGGLIGGPVTGTVGALQNIAPGTFDPTAGASQVTGEVQYDEPPTGEVQYDEPPPLVGPPAPPPLVGPPAPPPLVGPPAPDDLTINVPFVPTDRPLPDDISINVPNVTTDRPLPDDLVRNLQDVPTTEQTVETPEVAIEEPVDPAQENFNNTVNRVVTGSTEARQGYDGFVLEHMKFYDQNPEYAASQPEARENSYLQVDENGNERSVYVAEDGTQIELSERLGNIPGDVLPEERDAEGKLTKEGKERLAAEADLEPALSDKLNLFGSFIHADKAGNLKGKFEEFMYQVARYNKNYDGDPRGDLKVVIDIGGRGEGNTMGSHANYRASTNTITVSLSSLLEGDINWTEAAIHELTHQKLWSLFFRQLAKLYPDIKNIDQLTDAATLYINDFGFKLFKPFRKEIKSFIKEAMDIGGGTAVATRLNIPEGSPVYQALSEVNTVDSAFSILNEARSIDKSRDFANNISFNIIHELLAYESMTVEILKEGGQIPTESQRTFIQKFMRYLKQSLDQILGIKTLSKQDLREFIIVMFLESQNVMEAESFIKTQAWRYYKVDSARPQLATARRVMRGEGPVTRMAKEDEEIDLSKRRFIKQGAGIAAGAVVDPTILAEPAAKAAAAAVEPPAVSTVYRFAVSIPVETQEGDLVEGEAVVDIEYDSAKNTLSIQDLDEDAGIIHEDTFQVPIENPTMRQVDDFAANIIKTGTNTMDPNASQMFDPKAVYSVQPPHRDPALTEEAEEEDPDLWQTGQTEVPSYMVDRWEMDAEYKAVDLDYLRGIGGEVSYIRSVNPTDTNVEDFGYQAQFAEADQTPRVTLKGETISRPERQIEAPIEAPSVGETIDVAAALLEQSKALEKIQKTIEGEVVRGARREAKKEDPQLEWLLQEMQDIRATFQNRLDKLEEDAPIDEVKKLEEDIAEIEEEIKDAKEELSTIKGEPVLSQAKLPSRTKEELKSEYDYLVGNVTEKKQIPLYGGGFITLREMAKGLTGGIPGKPRSEAQHWNRYKEDFWIDVLKLIYGENSKNLTKPDITAFFNEWNMEVGKHRPKRHKTHFAAKQKGVEGYGKLLPEDIIQLEGRVALVDYPIKRIKEKWPIKSDRPIFKWGWQAKPSTIKEKQLATNINILTLYAEGKNVKKLFDSQAYNDRFLTIKRRLEDFLKTYYANGFPNEKMFDNRFSQKWYKANKDVKPSIVWRTPTGRTEDESVKYNILELAKDKLSGISDSLNAAKRRVRLKIAARNVKDRFKLILKNTKKYEEMDDVFKPVITKEIFDKFNKEKNNEDFSIGEFIENNLGVRTDVTKITTTWDTFVKHVTAVTGISHDLEHIIDIGVSDKVWEPGMEVSEETIDSLGYNHPFSWMAMPSILNDVISSKHLKSNAIKLGIINKNSKENIIPIDIPIIRDYIDSYFGYIDQNESRLENGEITVNELRVEAAKEASKILLLEENKSQLKQMGYQSDLKRLKRTIGVKLSNKELNELDLGTLEVEKAKRTLTDDPKKFFQLTRDDREELKQQIIDITDTDGNIGPKAEENSVTKEPITQQAKVKGTVKEYKREAGMHQTAFNTFTSFMWSKPVEAIRRYRYASPTMAKLADMIQRDISETKRVIKGGLDYIQSKGMALGQFRVALQSPLDRLTGRTGVMSKDVNEAVAKYLVQDTKIKNAKVAEAAEEMKRVLESIYVWSDKVGSKVTKDFSLRPLDGGLLPRVWSIEELATSRGRKKFMKLLADIGIKDDINSENEFEQTAATDAYNIALNSGGFISGDFTTTAYNQKSRNRKKYQVELFKKIEKEVSRRKLGTLLVNDIQAALPRFVDKAIEKTLYAEMFGHYDEALWEMKTEIEKEIRTYNGKESTKRPVNVERAMQDINDMMDIIRHRYKMQSTWFNPRRYLQWFTNFTTVTLMPFVSLASMPEFFTPVMLGSKNPVGFVNDFRSVSWYAALRAMNGMSKVFRGKQLDAMLYPKGKAARRAMFLKALGIIDIKSQGEAAAMRYIGPSFIRTGIAAQGPGAKMGIRALYKLYGLGNEASGRFRARKVRSLMNMDTYFEVVMLTTLTQMQQQMAANNLRRYSLNLLKSISKGKKSADQDKKILRDFGLTDPEISEAVRWYKAGHREFYDVPAEFKWDPGGMTLRFVDQVITRPNEATMSKAFRHPGMAPLLIFKSFMTTFGNTFMVAMRDRVKFAEGDGTVKTRRQAKMIAGYLATIGAMYGMVIFAQSVRQMLQYDDDDDNYMKDVPEWKKFIAMLNRTGLLTAPGSQFVDIFLPYKYGWWQKGGERAQDVILGPAYGQAKEILNLLTDLLNNGEVDLEKFLARIAPITKYEMSRGIVGASSYYEKD